MTLIAAFRTAEGAVLVADSQETLGNPTPTGWETYRCLVDKLERQEDGQYIWVAGGSGDGDLVDGFLDRLKDDIASWPLLNPSEIKIKLRSSLLDYRTNEVAASGMADDPLDFLICIKAINEDSEPVLFKAGKSVRTVSDFALIGWEEGIYRHDVQRHYKPDETSLFSMLLGIHLLLLAKATSNNIGGPSKVVVATNSNIRTVDAESVTALEQRVSLFELMLDDLRLRLPDTSISPDDFEDKLNEFKREVILLHLQYMMNVAMTNLERLKADPEATDEPYFSLPPFEKLSDFDRVSQKTAISSHVYALVEASKDLAITTRHVIAATEEAYDRGLLNLEQKDRIAELLVGIANGGKRGTKMLAAVHAHGGVLVSGDTGAAIGQVFADEVVSRYVQLESELAKLPHENTGVIRAAMEGVRASLLRSTTQRFLASVQQSSSRK